MEPDFSKAPPPRPESYFNASPAIFNEAHALAAAGDHAGAVVAYARCLTLYPGNAAALNNSAASLRILKELPAALAAGDAAAVLAPENPDFHSTRAAILMDLGRLTEGLAAAERALALMPDFVEAHLNRAVLLERLERPLEAFAAYDRIIVLNPAFAEAHRARGVLLGRLNRPAAAIAAFDRALALQPTLPQVHGTRLHYKMQTCDWSTFDDDVADLCRRVRRGEPATPAFPLLAATDDPEIHGAAAALWAARVPADRPLGPLPVRALREKIRVGYFSPDFRDHPVATLTARLFEVHDRARFEIIGFSTGIDTGDPMRKRLEKAFDRFIDVRTKSDREIAALARELETDIAVDLAGHTGTGRSGIFALRAAPVQINWLGYPGTMAADYMDYIIADQVIIGEADLAYYAEKPLQLPCFQPTDPTRPLPPPRPPRASLGLPEDGFVYCCFNGAYKITPEVFAIWVRILVRVPKSVLWLRGNNADMQANVRRLASALGVDPARIIFAPQVSAADHMARTGAADLFLDTTPYNAHTTASDALWAGLPVLTTYGKSYAARVTASLLKAVGLPLVADSLEQYEEMAVSLARDPTRMAGFKKQLADPARLPLFDIAAFTLALEEAYRKVAL